MRDLPDLIRELKKTSDIFVSNLSQFDKSPRLPRGRSWDKQYLDELKHRLQPERNPTIESTSSLERIPEHQKQQTTRLCVNRSSIMDTTAQSMSCNLSPAMQNDKSLKREIAALLDLQTDENHEIIRRLSEMKVHVSRVNYQEKLIQ